MFFMYMIWRPPLSITSASFFPYTALFRSVLACPPIQITATISAPLADPSWNRLVDAGRIGVAGFSAGGYTSLLVVVSEPRFDRFLRYCERHPDDVEICGLVKKLGDGEIGRASCRERVCQYV